MRLRGKIAYLFQRFPEERELTAMLLCMPGNPAEVKDLAAMVQGWIGLTHGDTPAARAGVRNALFLVLTKFDLEFIEKGGETSEARRGKWDRRLHSSFLELYGQSGWPDEIGRAHVCTPVTHAQLVCRLLLEKKKNTLHMRRSQ